MSCLKYPKIDTLYTRDEKFKVTNEIRRPEFLIPREWLVTEKIHGTNIRVSLEQRDFDISGLKESSWDLQINGRNDNSQIPPNLLRHLEDAFTLDGLKSLWRCKSNCEECGGQSRSPEEWPEGVSQYPRLDPYPIILYGEGYGGGIQKGGSEYTSKTKGGAVSFRLFDVLVGETWLRRVDVEDVAEKLGIKCVPLIPPPAPITYGPDPAFTRINLGGVTVVLEKQPWDLELIAEHVKNSMQSVVSYEEGTEGHPAEGVVAFTAEPLYNNRGQRLMFKLKAEDFA